MYLISRGGPIKSIENKFWITYPYELCNVAFPTSWEAPHYNDNLLKNSFLRPSILPTDMLMVHEITPQKVIITLSGRDNLPGALRMSSTFLISGFFSTRGGGGVGVGSTGAAGCGPLSSGKPLLSTAQQYWHFSYFKLLVHVCYIYLAAFDKSIEHFKEIIFIKSPWLCSLLA